MNSISGNSFSKHPGFDPQQMMQNMQDRMAQADTDQNGSISKTEALAQAEESGRQGPDFNKMFDKADANGDGELSQEEQTQMFEQMQQRMEQFESMRMGGGAGVASYGSGDSFQTLLDSLSTDDNGEEDSSDKRLREALNEVNAQNQKEFNQQGGGAQPWQTLNELAPPINTYA